ncbi:hypothetical protein [Streptomyces sp. NPDC055210]
MGELATTADRITVLQSDIDVVNHGTDAFASAGVVVAAGEATLRDATGFRFTELPLTCDRVRLTCARRA